MVVTTKLLSQTQMLILILPTAAANVDISFDA